MSETIAYSPPTHIQESVFEIDVPRPGVRKKKKNSFYLTSHLRVMAQLEVKLPIYVFTDSVHSISMLYSSDHAFVADNRAC